MANLDLIILSSFYRLSVSKTLNWLLLPTLVPLYVLNLQQKLTLYTQLLLVIVDDDSIRSRLYRSCWCLTLSLRRSLGWVSGKPDQWTYTANVLLQCSIIECLYLSCDPSLVRWLKCSMLLMNNSATNNPLYDLLLAVTKGSWLLKMLMYGRCLWQKSASKRSLSLVPMRLQR